MGRSAKGGGAVTKKAAAGRLDRATGAEGPPKRAGGARAAALSRNEGGTGAAFAFRRGPAPMTTAAAAASPGRPR